MPARHVVVDLDGTVLDTRLRHHGAYVRGAAALGADPLPLADYWRAKRRAVGWPRLLGGAPAAARFLPLWHELIESPDLLALDRLQPGAAAALRRLARAGYAPVLVTARRNADALEAQLRGLGVRSLFSDVVATGSGPKRLPAGLDPVRWIGDTEADVDAARAAGAPVTVVTNGIRCRSRLIRAAPDDIAPSLGVAVRRLLD